jgi:hypothetical protein
MCGSRCGRGVCADIGAWRGPASSTCQRGGDEAAGRDCGCVLDRDCGCGRDDDRALALGSGSDGDSCSRCLSRHHGCGCEVCAGMDHLENTTKLTLFKFSHQGPWLSYMYRMNRQYGASD